MSVSRASLLCCTVLENCWDLTLFLLLLLTARGHGEGDGTGGCGRDREPFPGPAGGSCQAKFGVTHQPHCGLGALGRGQHPAGCKSEASLLGKPGRFPSSSHPAEVGTGCVVPSVV